MELATRLKGTSYINPKDSIIEGLKSKIKQVGALAVPIEVTKTYPARESFEGTQQGTVRPKRLIVVKKLNSSVYKGAVGDITGGGLYDEGDIKRMGWLENGGFEISVWSSDSNDRDVMMTLLKLWMLELAQEKLVYRHSFFSQRGIFTAKYTREYEETNSTLIRNGVIYIGVLVYELVYAFDFLSVESREELELELVGKLNEKILI